MDDEELAGKIKVVVGEEGPDLTKPGQFMRSSFGNTAFDHFPRWLSAPEYADPAIAIRRYCRYRSQKCWKQFYKNLALCALSITPLTEYEKAGRLFILRSHVCKLIEASQLIYVRTGSVKKI